MRRCAAGAVPRHSPTAARPPARPPRAARRNHRPLRSPSGVLAIGDRILAVDGRQLKRRKLCDLMPQPPHLFKVQRLGEDAVSNRVSLPQNLREEIEEAKGGAAASSAGARAAAAARCGRRGGVAVGEVEARAVGGADGREGEGKKNNPFVMNDAQYDDWFK